MARVHCGVSYGSLLAILQIFMTIIKCPFQEETHKFNEKKAIDSSDLTGRLSEKYTYFRKKRLGKKKLESLSGSMLSGNAGLKADQPTSELVSNVTGVENQAAFTEGKLTKCGAEFHPLVANDNQNLPHDGSKSAKKKAQQSSRKRVHVKKNNASEGSSSTIRSRKRSAPKNVVLSSNGKKTDVTDRSLVKRDKLGEAAVSKRELSSNGKSSKHDYRELSMISRCKYYLHQVAVFFIHGYFFSFFRLK